MRSKLISIAGDSQYQKWDKAGKVPQSTAIHTGTRGGNLKMVSVAVSCLADGINQGPHGKGFC